MAEFEWIARYLKPIASLSDAYGLENDVARLRLSTASTSIVTMDTLVEGVHFLSVDPPGTLGRKLIRVNASDILCKGARPASALLSVAMPERFAESDFAALCSGLGRDLEEFGISLLGGDLVKTTGPLVLTLTLTGECCGAGPVLRAGALPGQAVLVTGVIGAGRVGHEHARNGIKSAFSDHYRVPAIPRLAFAHVLSDYATASIDVSDGLMADAGHIGEASKVGIELSLEEVPWCEAPASVEDCLRLASGGDDYQTLFTVAADKADACSRDAEAAGVRVTRIGTVRQGRGLALHYRGKSIPVPELTGYQH